jgi:hypothetical protein
MSDKARTMLDTIQHDHRQHVSANFPAPGICVSRCAERWPCQAYRAAAAALAALNLADRWMNTQWPDDGGDRVFVATEQIMLDGGALRSAITAALTDAAPITKV